MNKRPTSVTVIAWIIIILNALSLFGAAFTLNDPAAAESMAQSPIPIPLQHFLVFAGLAVSIICAIFMLRAANWARLLYIGWNGIYLLLLLLTSPVKAMIIPAIIVYAIIISLLLRKSATTYFASPGVLSRG